MAEPFVFHFKSGPRGEPLQMYIADVFGACGLCKADQIQRYYHAESFHTLNASELDRIATASLQKLDIECSNCGEHVGGEHAMVATVLWGFADDSGTLTAWVEPDAKPVWVSNPSVRLDPQTLPGKFKPEGGVEMTDLFVENALGRAINPKHVWLDLFDDLIESPGVVYDSAAHDYLLAVGTESVDAIFSTEDLIVSFADPPNSPFLPLQEVPERLFASLIGWVPTDVLARIRAGEWIAKASVSEAVIREAIERAFSVANLTFSFDEPTRAFVEITTPTEITFDHSVPVVSVAQRAVWTGMTPGEAARLTAEEIVGTLLRVWP